MIGRLYTPQWATVNPVPAQGEVSPAAFSLFRLIERLSRRAGYACVNALETLAAMHGRCERATRYALAELKEAGWIERAHTRKRGRSRLFLRPLVTVPTSRSRFPKPSLLPRPLPPVLQDAPPTPLEGEERRDSNSTAHDTADVVVILSKEIPSLRPNEAQSLAKEAVSLSPEDIRRIIGAYRAQSARIRNTGAWLRMAIRDKYAPPLPSERLIEAPKRVLVTLPPLPAQSPGGGMAAWRQARERLTGKTARV